jgi:RHS repeat-associated protein
VNTIYTANNLNQLDSVSFQEGSSAASDPVAITYDANGNMTYNGANQTFEWDAANRLIAINYIGTGDRTEFAYDGLGHRVKITEYGPAVTLDVQPKSGGFVGFGTDEFNLPTGEYEVKFEGLNPEGGDNTALVDSVMLNETMVQNGGFENPPGLVHDTTAPNNSDWNYADLAGIAAATGVLMDGLSAPEGAQAAFVSNRGALWQYGSVTPATYTLGFQAAQYSGNDFHQTLRASLRGATSTKTFLWNGDKIAIADEHDSSGSIVRKRFFAEGEQRIGGKHEGLYYYSRDHLGSIREVTNETGDLIAQYDYDAWGKQVAGTSTMTVDFGYTGHYFHQASGLNLTLYRAYDPTLGRWISRDPIGEYDGLNLYEYVTNDPIDKFDRLGLAASTMGDMYGFVCCRSVRYEGGDPPMTWLAQKLSIRHCQIKDRCDSNEDAYPIVKRNTGKLDTGKCCGEATRPEILGCISRHPYYNGSATIGSNCQTSVFETLSSCCLKSEWVPSWYK